MSDRITFHQMGLESLMCVLLAVFDSIGNLATKAVNAAKGAFNNLFARPAAAIRKTVSKVAHHNPIKSLFSGIHLNRPPKKRPQDVEDCVACRYVWLQVEMEVCVHRFWFAAPWCPPQCVRRLAMTKWRKTYMMHSRKHAYKPKKPQSSIQR